MRLHLNSISESVVPVFRRMANERSWAGTAFVADGRLITAGHVLTHPQPYYARISGRYVELQPDRWMPQLLPAMDKLQYDAAAYPMPLVTGPLTLATDDVAAHDELELTGWQRQGGILRQVNTPCLVLRQADEDGYFLAATVEHVTHGASGSPIMRDGKVYGILTMGREDYELPIELDHLPARQQRLITTLEENTCWIYKTTHIRRFLTQ